METTIAYCGLSCDTCPVYLATLEEDSDRQRKMRESIAEQCSKLYGMNLLYIDINDCDGCRAIAGRIFAGCLNCEIRKCVIGRNIDSCAFCNDYACDILEKHFSLDPGAKVRLEEVRKKTNNFGQKMR